MAKSGTWGKLIHVENLKSKISWHCPLNDGVPWMLDLSGSDSKLILYVSKTLDSSHLLPFPFMLFPYTMFPALLFP
jgi:hypothetical protein